MAIPNPVITSNVLLCYLGVSCCAVAVLELMNNLHPVDGKLMESRVRTVALPRSDGRCVRSRHRWTKGEFSKQRLNLVLSKRFMQQPYNGHQNQQRYFITEEPHEFITAVNLLALLWGYKWLSQSGSTLSTEPSIPRNKFIPSYNPFLIGAYEWIKHTVVIGKDPTSSETHHCPKEQAKNIETHCSLQYRAGVYNIVPGRPPDEWGLVGLYGGRIKIQDVGGLVTGITEDSCLYTICSIREDLPYSIDATNNDDIADTTEIICPSFSQPRAPERLVFDARNQVLHNKVETNDYFSQGEDVCPAHEMVVNYPIQETGGASIYTSSTEAVFLGQSVGHVGTNVVDYISQREDASVKEVSSQVHQNWDREHSSLVPNHEIPRLSGDGDSAKVSYKERPEYEMVVENYPIQETSGDLVCASSMEAVSLGQSVGHMGEGDSTQFPLGGRTIPAVLSTPAVQQPGDQPSGNREATRQPVQPAYICGLLQQASAIMAESLNPVVVHVHQADWAPNVKFKIDTVIKQDGDLIVQEQKAVTDPADRERYPEAFVHHRLLQHVKKHASEYGKLLNCSDKELVQWIDDVIQSFPREGALPPTAEQAVTILQKSSRFLERVEAGLSRTNEMELCQKVFDGVEKMHQLAQYLQC